MPERNMRDDTRATYRHNPAHRAKTLSLIKVKNDQIHI